MDPLYPVDPLAPLSPVDPAADARLVDSGMGDGPGPDVMAAATLDGNKVISSGGEDLGKISDIMLDVRGGHVAYAVLTAGGFLGMGGTLHAIPWSALTLDPSEKCFRLDATAEHVKSAPGFDKDHWPSMADPQWGAAVYQFYEREPYWQATRAVVENDPAARIESSTGL